MSSYPYYQQNNPPSSSGGRDGEGSYNDYTRPSPGGNSQGSTVPSTYGQQYPGQHQYQNAAPVYPANPSMPPQQYQQQPQPPYNNRSASSAAANPVNSSSNSYGQQQYYPPATNDYNSRAQAQPAQGQLQQTDYSKYQFLPYGQPRQPAPPPQKPPQYSNYYAEAPNQYQQQYSYPPPNQGAVQSTPGVNPGHGGYSYPPYSSYGQQPPQGAGYGASPYSTPPPPQYQQSMSYPPPNYPPGQYSSGHPQMNLGGPPAPVPMPVPVPPPASHQQAPVAATPEKSHKTHGKRSQEEDPEQSEWEERRAADKLKREQELEALEPKELKKPVPIMVGKRRGGRTLPTGVVKKSRAESPEANKRTDAWSQYMNEVRRYKERSCEDERKNRPLVK